MTMPNPTCAESIVAINEIKDLGEKSSLHVFLRKVREPDSAGANHISHLESYSLRRVKNLGRHYTSKHAVSIAQLVDLIHDDLRKILKAVANCASWVS